MSVRADIRKTGRYVSGKKTLRRMSTVVLTMTSAFARKTAEAAKAVREAKSREDYRKKMEDSHGTHCFCGCRLIEDLPGVS